MFNAFADDVAQTFNTVQPIAYGGTGSSDLKLTDTDFGIKDNGDPTKIGQFNASNLPTATTRTYDLPYYSGTLGLVSDIRGQIYGLTLSNNVTDATNDIDIAAGSAVDSTGAASMVLSSVMTKRTDAAWAVGSGNGGWLDGSAMPNGTGHVFLMRRSDTGVIDIGISASATAPVLPANYDRKRRIGAIIRDSGVILPFSQAGNKFLLKTPVNVIVGNDPGTSAVLQTMKVPIGIQVDLLAEIYMQSTDANRRALKITSPDQNDVAPSAGTMSTFVAGTTSAPGNISGTFEVRTNTSGQFRFRLDSSSATTSLFFTTNGWIDYV